MNTDDIKEEIRRRIDIAELIGRYVPLQRAGSRLRARCPFHQERTPSFYVDPDRGFWKCFGCGAAGDLFSFVMRIEGLTFPEAAERLAERAGLQWRTSPQGEKTGRERQDILRANDEATEFFQQQLQGPAGEPARQYLAKRGLKPETCAAFRLGYAPPGWDNLLRHMAGKGFGEQLLEHGGLVKRSDRGGHYDVFRHRIIYPIIDVSGRVVGFGGRALDPDDPAKYLNSPDTPVFKKGATVYGLHLARPAITERKRALVVEGYMDVIALVEGGFPNVVACLGTATTEAHLHLLARYAEQIVFVFDADAAGMRAALRNVQLFEASSADAKIAILPEGQDPDDCVRQGGPAVFQQCLDQAVSFVEYEIRMAFARYDPSDTDGRLRAAREAVDILLKVKDQARREEMLERTADWWARGDPARAEALAKALRMELRRRGSQQSPERTPRPHSRFDRGFIMETVAASAGVGDPRVLALEREVLAGALSDPELARQVAARLTAKDFHEPRHQQIAAVLLPRASAPDFSPAEVVAALPEEGDLQALAVELRLSQDGFDQEEFAGAIANLLQYRGALGLRPKYQVSAENEPEDDVESEEDFLALERKVQQAVNAGLATPDDPDVQRYQRLQRRFRGKGRGYVEHAGQTPLGTGQSSSSGPPEPAAPKDEEPPVPS